MTTPALVLQGQVDQPIQPTRIAAAHASPAHEFFNVVRDLVATGTYHTENERLSALDAVSRYETHVVTPGDLRQVASENDRAPYEDVSKRIPPNPAQVSPVLPPGIDYSRLAAAIAAHMQAAQEAPAAPPVPVQQ